MTFPNLVPAADKEPRNVFDNPFDFSGAGKRSAMGPSQQNPYFGGAVGAMPAQVGAGAGVTNPIGAMGGQFSLQDLLAGKGGSPGGIPGGPASGGMGMGAGVGGYNPWMSLLR